MRAWQSRSAFSYVELIIVISIISVLLALLLPVFAKARENARKSACASNLRQIGLALHIYARDFDGRFPPEHDNLAPVAAYLRELAVFRCPSEQPVKTVYTKGSRLANAAYRYFGGLSLDVNRASSVAFASDRTVDLHNDSTNFLYVDAHVRALPTVVSPHLGSPIPRRRSFEEIP